jgi:RNA polymerase sigma factor for flagellar operon FliA
MTTLPNPPGDLTPEQLFLGHLPLVKEIIAHGCRRSRFSKQDAEDFHGRVMVKLIEEDYAVFRLFEGRSEIKTYLTIVINRVLLDFQNYLWQKWRNSAEAGRLGPIAEQLERLIVRDRCRFDEACRILQSQGVEMSEAELEEIQTKLPVRFVRSFVPDETLQTMASREPRPDEVFEQKERKTLALRVLRALNRALQELPAEERLLVHMRMELKVADIARALKKDQKPLYRQLDKTYGKLRESLKQQGIRRKDIEDILGGLQPGLLDF